MEATAVSEPVEHIDSICLDKSLVLPDGCTTATLMTEDGEAVTLILSNKIPDSNDIDGSAIEVNDSDILTEASINEEDKNTFVPSAEDGTVYSIGLTSNVKNENEMKCTESSQESAEIKVCEETSEKCLDKSTQNINEEMVQTNTNLDDFMDVVTTYKCKFCRFSCPWKSGLVSHIRCCHIAEHKKSKNGKDPNIVIASKQQKKESPTVVGKKKKLKIAHHVEHVYSFNNSKKEDKGVNHVSDQVTKESPGVENVSKQLKKEYFDDERHIFLCGQCSDGFATLDDCKQHMIDDHNIKIEQKMFKPLRKRGRPSARKVSESTNTIKAEVKDSPKKLSHPPITKDNDFTDYGEKKVKKESQHLKLARCTYGGCGHRFSSTANLHYHYTCHAPSGKTFICPECRLCFEHWRGVVMHLWKDHTIDVDLHTCSECDYKTYSFFKLDNHIRIHSNERAFVCQTCGKGFKQISQLRNHLVIHLDRRNLPEKRWYSEQHCEICGRKFSDTKCLRKHQQAVHSKLKPFVCSFCGHLSARKAMLDLHMRQHTGEKPFVCEHCDYRTGDHNSLRRHRMRHTGDKPYKCPHCPYACIQAISYKTHLRNKHPGMDGLYCCNICTFKSVSKENYVNHMGDHKRESETLVDDPDPVMPIDVIQSEDSAVQMHLNDNALQQLEGILPGNITAAQLIYSCLNALSQDGGTVNFPPGVTVNVPSDAGSSSDGTQTITIQLPSSQEDESESFYFSVQNDSTASLNLSEERMDDESNGVKIQEESNDLDNVNFGQQDAAGNSMDCVLQEEDSDNLHETSDEAIVITNLDSFNDAESFVALTGDGPEDGS